MSHQQFCRYMEKGIDVGQNRSQQQCCCHRNGVEESGSQRQHWEVGGGPGLFHQQDWYGNAVYLGRSQQDDWAGQSKSKKHCSCYRNGLEEGKSQQKLSVIGGGQSMFDLGWYGGVVEKDRSQRDEQCQCYRNGMKEGKSRRSSGIMHVGQSRSQQQCCCYSSGVEEGRSQQDGWGRYRHDVQGARCQKDVRGDCLFAFDNSPRFTGEQDPVYSFTHEYASTYTTLPDWNLAASSGSNLKESAGKCSGKSLTIHLRAQSHHRVC